jgi:hypothetical protein
MVSAGGGYGTILSGKSEAGGAGFIASTQRPTNSYVNLQGDFFKKKLSKHYISLPLYIPALSYPPILIIKLLTCLCTLESHLGGKGLVFPSALTLA